MAQIIDLAKPARAYDTKPAPDARSGAEPYDPLADLLRATARGERDAFARLYDLLSPKLLALTTRILRRRDLGEEALHEAFIRIWRTAHRYEPAKGKAQAWVTTIARNVALTMVVRYQREQPDSPRLERNDRPSPLPDPFDQALIFEEARQLATCLQHLPDRQMQAIVLAYLEGLSHSELARSMDLPLGTAKSAVRRGLIGLRRCMDGDGPQEDLAPLLAGEYSLGLLRGKARDRFGRRRSGDAHLCHLTDIWDHRLAGLADLLPEIAPPAPLWHAIEEDLPPYRGRGDLQTWRVATCVLAALSLILLLLLTLS
jgi:RNA polymerase sigma-70 factor (ECF subfamily)